MTIFKETNCFARLVDQIRSLAIACSRDPKEIFLIAVSKTHPWNEIQPVYDAGCCDFGENRVQEALAKMEGAPENICWHLIGSLQKNKVKKIIGRFDLIHSVDSFDLAKKISECSIELDIQTHLLLQVNTSNEASKHGLSFDQWRRDFDRVLLLPNLSIDGLMTIGPLTENREVTRECFSNLRSFRDELSLRASSTFSYLSMGMSGDYQVAIEEGATHLRIGSAIFGKKRTR